MTTFAYFGQLTLATVSDESVCAPVEPGPCTVQRIPLTDPLPTPLEFPAVFYPTSGKGSLRNEKFAQEVLRTALSARLGHEIVRLTSSNAYSDGEVEMPLSEYLGNLNRLSSCGSRSNETLYLFGGNYSPGWTKLLDEYALPPCLTCLAPDNAAVSFGCGGMGSGVAWHRHGPGFSEVLHGAKRWFLLPANGPLDMHSFDVNRSVADWAWNDLPLLGPDAGVQECTIYPGEILYFPHNWPHATLNLGEYTAFSSTFIIDE